MDERSKTDASYITALENSLREIWELLDVTTTQIEHTRRVIDVVEKPLNKAKRLIETIVEIHDEDEDGLPQSMLDGISRNFPAQPKLGEKCPIHNVPYENMVISSGQPAWVSCPECDALEHEHSDDE